ncbi:transmembrane protein 39A [Lepeophtheirus salmonis]|uniref:transmembrane protein 39A n=1 Tax=Lepeophtheirus salmonis TaxID=72036 RepID=UPI001AEAD34B|nr:transmembrane protein 39A-like [Lepeophtheirus salmonis]
MAGGNRKNVPKGGTRSPLLNKNSTSNLPMKTSSNPPPEPLLVDDKNTQTCSYFRPTPDDISVILPEDSIFTFEILVFLYSFATLLLQHLILYHSVWWQSHSHNSNAMKFYLIDTNVIKFSSLIIGRRVIWLSIKSFIGALVPTNWKESVIIVARSITSFFILTTLLCIASFFVLYHPLVTNLYLVYPMSMYFFLFGLAGEPFLELFPKHPTSKALNGLLKENYLPTSPESIRADVIMFKADYSMKRKQALFNSIISAYYSAYVPCCFTPRSLHYDIEWVGRHVFLVWLGLLSLYNFRCFPASYNHRMHRLAQRLGLWTKIEGRLSANFYSRWTPNTVWKSGQIVRYGKDLYKAESLTNSAEPGNAAQTKFYEIFSNPNDYLLVQLILQMILIATQQITLFLCVYWYQLLSVSILLFANYYMLFKLFRNYDVLGNFYGRSSLFTYIYYLLMQIK